MSRKVEILATEVVTITEYTWECECGKIFGIDYGTKIEFIKCLLKEDGVKIINGKAYCEVCAKNK